MLTISVKSRWFTDLFNSISGKNIVNIHARAQSKCSDWVTQGVARSRRVQYARKDAFNLTAVNFGANFIYLHGLFVK